VSPGRFKARTKKNRATLAKPHTIDASCRCGKRAYPTKGGAGKAVRLLKDHQPGEAVHAYHCPADGGWHVGHKGFVR